MTPAEPLPGEDPRPATVIVGRDSNLSARLAKRAPAPTLISAREFSSEGFRRQLPAGPFSLVLNNFQAATRLDDVRDPESFVQVSLGVTASILGSLADYDVRKIIYTSSASVYGDNTSCREDDRLMADSLHSSLKVANESLVRSAGRRHGIDTTIVRLFNMYGGDDNFSLIAKIIDAARLGTPLRVANRGNAVRDFIHVDDVVDVYEVLLDRRDIPVVNVATGFGTSVRSILDAVRREGYELEIESVRRREIDVSIADVTVLSGLVDVGRFGRVVEHVLESIRR